MKINSGPHGGGRKSFMSWVGTLVLGSLVTLGSAYAAPPEAGTEIGNQALARYIDSGGTQQESKSNNALTIVQQVGAFTLVDNNTKSASAGNTVYMPHTLTNTGNGSDKFKLSVAETLAGAPPFTKIAIYADANGTGLPSGTALCSTDMTPACTTGFEQTVAGNGGVFRFVVAYSVPPTATGTWTSKATVTAAAGTTSLYPSNNLTVTNLDTVNLTDGTAFSVTKSLSLPGVKAPGGVDWPKAITGGPPSAASCSTTWSAALSSAPGCTYAVYTISFTNTGAKDGAFSVRDTLPAGLTYVTGSGVWSGNGGVALSETATTGAVVYSVTGSTVRATVAKVAVGQQGTLSFVVLVNSTAKPDGSNTANVAYYGSGDCPTAGSAGDSCTTTPTNKVPFTPSVVYGVVAASTDASPVKDASTPPAISTAQNNLVTQPTVTPNGSVRFSNFIINTGNAVDSFNIKAVSDPAQSPYPTGTRFDLFKPDGLTPLLDTNNDGVPDTGPLDPGASYVVVVKAILPPEAIVGSGPFNVLITATSVAGGQSVLDSVWDQVGKVVLAAGVDLTNTAAGTGSGLVGNGDLGAGPSPNPTMTLGTTPGVPVGFPLFIKNTDSQNNTYQLNASSSASFPGSLPASWTVTYYAAGTSCVPTPPAATMPAQLTQPVAVAAGAQLQVMACVTPATTATTDVVQPIYFQAVSTTVASSGFIVSDVLQDAVDVKPAKFKKLLLTSSQTGQVATPGSVVYLHTLSNAGTQTCGTTGANAVINPGSYCVANANPKGCAITDPATVSASTLLSLSKALLSSGLVAGTPASYQLTITNQGSRSSATSLDVYDTLPVGLRYQSAAGAACTVLSDTAAGQTLKCTLSSANGIAAGSSAAFTVQATPQASLVGQFVSNRARIDSSGANAVQSPASCAGDGSPDLARRGAGRSCRPAGRPPCRWAARWRSWPRWAGRQSGARLADGGWLPGHPSWASSNPSAPGRRRPDAIDPRPPGRPPPRSPGRPPRSADCRPVPG